MKPTVFSTIIAACILCGPASQLNAEAHPEIVAFVKAKIGLDHSDKEIIELIRGKFPKENPKSIPWCGIWMEYVARQHGLQVPANPEMARSWLKVGKAIDKPEVGAVIVTWRKNPQDSTGHVGIIVAVREDGLDVLGGNQGPLSRVCVSTYSWQYCRDMVLGYRRLGKTKPN